LLRKLEGLHRQGYIFGDLKANNMLVTAFGEVELVDYGGVTEEGRSVKQFTEIYDCGFWNAGERVASVSYDLFSFAIVCLHMNGMDRQLKTLADSTLPLNRSVDDLLALVDRCPPCSPVAAVLKQALTGKLDSCAKAASLWRDGMHSVGVSGAGRGQKQSQWIGTAFLASLGLLVSLLCVFWLSN
jgi:serine/threonine-protein kinase